jgi:ATP-binding cassette subfamily C protein
VSARQGWRRLKELLEKMPPVKERMALPAPSEKLEVDKVTLVPPGARTPSALDVSFSLEAGQGLGIIGPSGSGKTSLIRALVGVWAPAKGSVRLDGAALDQWNPDDLGPHIGYLPQDVELFSGTFADNISRFEDNPESEHIIAAAKAADIHELILQFPDGYDTELGESGTALSAGQRQRVALARALYGDPFLVVLDEPNSNLDSEGEVALTAAIKSTKDRGGIVIVVAHRPSALAAIDQVMMMKDGRVQALGPKDEVLGKVLKQAAPATGLRVVPNKPGTV